MELLFDDRWVDHKAGVRRVLGQPSKEPEPVLAREREYESEGLQAFQALLFDETEQRFKLWYRATCPDGRAGKRNLLCYAESDDGRRWERPDLGLFSLDGSTKNNIVREIDTGDSVFFNIVQDPDDPDPRRRYKALGFQAFPEASDPFRMAVSVAYSPDGWRWSEPRPLISTRDLTDADCILGQRDPTTGKWVAFFRPRTSPKRRFLGSSESQDFERWGYPRMLLTPDAGDDEWVEFYGLTAACLERFRVGLLWVFHNHPIYSPMTTELVYSRDGLEYERAMAGEPFLPLGARGSFDSRMVIPVALITRPGEHLLFYQGSNTDHGSDRGQKMPPGRAQEGEAPTGGLGLARLPWGQFCGLQARLDGMVETKYLCNYGRGGIRAVVATEEGGFVRVEVLDQYRRPIPGWEADRSTAQTGSHGITDFQWPDGLNGAYGQKSASQGAVGHVIKLRFHLHRATLYGFGCGEEGEFPEVGENSTEP